MMPRPGTIGLPSIVSLAEQLKALPLASTTVKLVVSRRLPGEVAGGAGRSSVGRSGSALLAFTSARKRATCSSDSNSSIVVAAKFGSQ